MIVSVCVCVCKCIHYYIVALSLILSTLHIILHLVRYKQSNLVTTNTVIIYIYIYICPKNYLLDKHTRRVTLNPNKAKDTRTKMLIHAKINQGFFLPLPCI